MIRYKKIDKQYVVNKIHGLDKVFKVYVNKVICAYLFGSMKSGRITPLSDIDIAVLFDGKLTRNEMELYENKLYMNLTQYFKTDEIDLVILNDAPPSVQYGVIKVKSIIYFSDFYKMIDFENKVIMNYLDFKPYREEYNKAFIKAMV
jgi:uncharacterized protein